MKELDHSRDGDLSVLILAPIGRDASLASSALVTGGFTTEILHDLDALMARLRFPCGAVLIAEEALTPNGIPRLATKLAEQSPWSDLPIIILTTERSAVRYAGGVDALAGTGGLDSLLFPPHGNVTLIERPLRVINFCTAVEAALRARRRQYQLRDLLQERDEALADMKEANRAKDHFLAALSHELRTPLTPVLLTVAALRQDPALPDTVRNELETIQRNVELEARLIDDLLDVTRISSGKLLLQLEVIDLTEILERALENCRSGEAARKRLRISEQCDATEHHTYGDPARLQQILWNLLNNATKFSPTGSSISIRLWNPVPGRIAISVTDAGIGIDPAVLPRLFTAFQQGDVAVTRQFGGLGLGLAISRKLADLHGGTVNAASDGPGKGATFTLELDTAAAPAPLPAINVATLAEPAVRSLQILLVEDHEPTRVALSRLLTHAGHLVIPASTVAGGLACAAEQTFDVVVSDLGLPDASGLDLMRELGSRYQLPGIALSGYGTERDVLASREAGFRMHITKPVDWRRLQETLAAITRPSAA